MSSQGFNPGCDKRTKFAVFNCIDDFFASRNKTCTNCFIEKFPPLQLKLLNDDEDMTLIDLLDCVFNSTLPLTAAVFKNAPTVLVCGNEVDKAT